MKNCFYASTFIDESLSPPDRSGKQVSTGRLKGFVFGRKFYKTKTGKIKAERIIIPFSWNEDTEEAKAAALTKAIEGMVELPELDKNPPLNYIPSFIKEKLNEASKDVVCENGIARRRAVPERQCGH